MTVKNIIFDLGGVILDLGFERMVNSFENLGIKDFSAYFNPQKQVDFFEELELGLISPEIFYDKFREATNSQLTDEIIEENWNLILKDFQKERIDLLTELSADFSLYLFSNTNAIHAKCFEQRCIEEMGQPLSTYFRKTYYSHDLHLRKPTVESFQEVLRQSNLKADETLFIDDNADNILGAQAAGLKTYHLKAPKVLTELNFQEIIY